MAHRPINPHPAVADILLRVSTTGQADDTRFSLPTQEAACRAFAAARGWTIHAIQQDAISGETIYRPGFQAVLDDLATGRVGRVIVYDVDRAGRDTYVGATLLHACKEAGATLHIQQMPDLELATGTPTANMGEMLFFMRLTQAAQELAGIRERTQRGRQARVAAGKPIIGPVPLYGYQFTYDERGEKVGYAPHPVYAPVVVRIFTEVAAGRSVGAIRADLNRDGVPTRAQAERETSAPGMRRTVGTQWQRGAISSIIGHPAYAGAPAANRYDIAREHGLDPDTGLPRTHSRHRIRSAQDAKVVPLPLEAWPPLVSPELAAAARARLMANQEESARHRAHGEREATLLRAGYVYCLGCGRPMTTERYRRRSSRARNQQPYWLYRCKHGKDANGRVGVDYCNQSIAAASLDAQVWAHVVRLAEDEEVAEAALAKWHADAGTHLVRQKAARATAAAVLAEATAETARLVTAIARETDDRLLERLRVLWREAEAHEAQARDALDRLDARLARDTTAQQYSDLQTWAREWRGRVRDASYAEKRQTLYRLGLRVFVAPAEFPHLVARAARGLPGGEERHFVVVLGWPQGVKQAIPWLVVPLLPGETLPPPREFHADQYAYTAQYYPLLEDDHSEVVRVVPTDSVALETTGTTVTLGGVGGFRRVRQSTIPPLGAAVGEQLGEVVKRDEGRADAPVESGTAHGKTDTDKGAIVSQSSG